MKVALTYKDGNIFGHFGRCEEFKIYDINIDEIVSSEVVSTNGISHAALVPFLIEKDVQMLLCGGIGDHAVALLSEQGIKVFPGCEGDADKNIDDLVNFRLKYDEAAIHKCTGNH